MLLLLGTPTPTVHYIHFIFIIGTKKEAVKKAIKNLSTKRLKLREIKENLNKRFP
jgi:hypothetical protein